MLEAFGDLPQYNLGHHYRVETHNFIPSFITFIDHKVKDKSILGCFKEAEHFPTSNGRTFLTLEWPSSWRKQSHLDASALRLYSDVCLVQHDEASLETTESDQDDNTTRTQSALV